tara:strand:- start:563 stop:2023 length:1461 start_codon:yes stop_codon:yes gene_type:complete
MSALMIGFSYPPFYGFLSWIAFIPLIEIWHRENPNKSFFYGYLFGFFSNLIILYWIGLNSGADKTTVLGSLIAALIYLSLFPGFLGFLISFLLKKTNKAFFLIPFAWTSMELIRSFGPLGFPWLNLSLTQSSFLPLIQIIDIFGNEIIGFIILLVNVLIFITFKKHLKIKTLSIILLIIFFPIFSYGFYKIDYYKDIEKFNSRKVSILQPNIDPNLKWNSTFKKELYAIMDSLNFVAYESKPDLVLWPESALPTYVRVSSVKNKLKEVVRNFNIPSLIGTLDVSWDSNKRRVFNGSIFLGVKEEKMYHKILLVPFAEYNPLNEINFLKNITYWDFGHGSFTPGTEHTTFNIDSIRFSNVICYESSHPKISRKMILSGARFLTIQANDAWLSNSSGVIQHFELARLRAVELRTGIARSANTGISGIIYPDGKIGGKIPFDNQGILKNNVILNDELSIYAKFGSVFAYICFIISISLTTCLCFLKKIK